MSDSNAVNLAFIEETTFGDVPSGPPTLKDLRFTSESLKLNTTTTISQELRFDRQIADFVRTNISAGGDVNWELSYGAFDDLFKGTLLSAAWTTPTTIGAITTVSFESISTSSTSNPKILDSANGLAALTVNSWVKVSGASTGANNVIAKVLVSSAAEIEVSVANAAGDLTDESAGASVTIVEGAEIKNGATFESYHIEKEFTDVASTFHVYQGMTIDTMSMSVTPDGIITGSFGFLGKNLDGDNSATVGDGSNTAAATGEVMNAIDNVSVVLENAGAYSVTEFSLSLANNLRQRLQVATLGAISIGTGTVNVTGTINAYFDATSQAKLAKYFAFTSSSLAILFTDAASDSYVFDLPRVKFGDGDALAEGINTDVMTNLSFQSYREATENTSIRIVRFT